MSADLDDRPEGPPAQLPMVGGAEEQAPQRAARLPLAEWTVPFLALLGIAALFFLAAIWIDYVTAARGPDGRISLAGLYHSVASQDLEQARNTMGGLGEVMAAILGLALTVSSIIVQLAATRFTPQVTSLFFRARANIVVLGFFVVCNVFVLWVNFSLGESYVPRAGTFMSMMALTASLLLLFPYFAYVFYFLDPDSIIGRIRSDGLRASIPTKGNTDQTIPRRQRRASEAIENLANIGLNAVQQKDKNIASSSVDALCAFATRYGETKAGMLQSWNAIPKWNRENPDFVSLSDEAIDDLRQRGTWLEWKILRQFQMLFNEGLGRMKDLCYLVAIDTRRLGEAAASRGDLQALDLAIKFFNTYLRATINASDIRTAYNILHQYRQLAEYVVSRGRQAEDAVGDLPALEGRGLEVAKFMRYYSGIAFQRKMTFITEVIAHDVGTLTGVAFHADAGVQDDLLETFLSVDDTAETSEQEQTLRGVRRAQVKLATTYLVHGAVDRARKIQADMKDEPPRRLRSIWQELDALRTREFWEVNDRGTNFDYLTDQQKAQLPVFFHWFKDLVGENAPRKKVPTMAPSVGLKAPKVG